MCQTLGLVSSVDTVDHQFSFFESEICRIRGRLARIYRLIRIGKIAYLE
jgi:hypothetical protein